MKLRLQEIDWDEIAAAYAGAPPVARAELATLRRNILTYPIYCFTRDFVERIFALEEFFDGDLSSLPLSPLAHPDTPVVIQIDNGTGHGPSDCTILVATAQQLVAMPLPTGGHGFYDAEMDRFLTPPVFRHANTSDSEMDEFGRMLAQMMRLAVLCLELPEIIQTESVPSRRVVRKGRSVRQPEYRTVGLYPGAERVVRERMKATVRKIAKRAAPIEHEVSAHFISRGLDKDCDHDFVDITTPEVLRREQCTKCEGKRTLRSAFKRGDPDKVTRPLVRVVH